MVDLISRKAQVEVVYFAWHNDTVVCDESVLDGLSIAVGRVMHDCSSRCLKSLAVRVRAREGFTGSERFILPYDWMMIIIKHHSVRDRDRELVPDRFVS